MIVVADSGPLHYLALINKSELLRVLYGEVLVPLAVVAELTSENAPKLVSTWITNPPDWLSFVSVGSDAARQINARLGLGEREALALARQRDATLILMDDAPARLEAKRLGFRITGTLGVLLAAAQENLIDAPTVIEDLKSTNFYMDERLLDIFRRHL